LHRFDRLEWPGLAMAIFSFIPLISFFTLWGFEVQSSTAMDRVGLSARLPTFDAAPFLFRASGIEPDPDPRR
jgi:hypothetical protein